MVQRVWDLGLTLLSVGEVDVAPLLAEAPSGRAARPAGLG